MSFLAGLTGLQRAHIIFSVFMTALMVAGAIAGLFSGWYIMAATWAVCAPVWAWSTRSCLRSYHRLNASRERIRQLRLQRGGYPWN